MGPLAARMLHRPCCCAGKACDTVPLLRVPQRGATCRAATGERSRPTVYSLWLWAGSITLGPKMSLHPVQSPVSRASQ